MKELTTKPASSAIESFILNGNHRDDALSLRDSLTAFSSNGISFWFVTMMPEATSRNFPFEKSKGFPAASVAIPPASAQVQLPNNHIYKKKELI